MKKVLLTVFAILILFFGCLAWAGDTTYTGVVSDSHCGAKHSTPGAEQCVEGCVAGGAKYVLVSEGKIYQLDPQEKFKGLGGKGVKVTGTLKDDTITVSAVSAE